MNPRPGAAAVTSSFVGRAAELAAVASSLDRDRLVSVVGPGGSGKTRLVVEAVRAGLFAMAGYVELAPVGPGDGVADAVLVACGIRDEPGQAPFERLVDRLRVAEGVLVLDNCEQVRVEVAAVVAGLLRECAALRVLVTGRVSLGVIGERVLSIGGLDVDGDAAALFVDRAGRVQPELPVGPVADAAVRRICRLADGLPLAVELAAAHTRALALPEVEAGMSDRLRFLTTRDPGVLPQHRSLQASIEWSTALVGERARWVLSCLSVFGGRFTLDAAVAVAGPEGRAALEVLVDHSLVQFDAAEGRYLLLDTVREHAAVELAVSKAGAAGREVRVRLVRWVAALAASVAPGLGRADGAALARVERDDAAVRAALTHARSDPQRAAGIVVDLAFAWSLRGRCAEGREWARRVGATLGVPSPGLAWAEAFLTVYSGDLEPGFGLAVAAAEHAATVGEARAHGRALILVGMVQMFVDPAGAEPVLAEAAELAADAGDDWGRVEALQTQAYTHLHRTDHRSALACADAALPALERLDHAQLRAWDAAIRADVAEQTGHFTDACTHGWAGVRGAVGLGEPVSASGALLPLVRALCQRGRTVEASGAVAAHRPFLDTHPGLGGIESLALADAVLAYWSGAAEAVERIEQAWTAAVAAGVASLAGEAGAMLAVARLAAGDPAGGVVAADEALAQAAAIGNRGIVCAATLVRCAAQRACDLGTTDATHRVLAEAAATGLRPLVPDALDLVAGHALDADRPAVAARLHAAATRLRDELGARPSPLACLLRNTDEARVTATLEVVERVAAMEQGARLGLDEAVAYASRSRGRRARPRAGWDSLTPTEREVVALAARGLSNPAIAAQLLIAPGTVRTHLRSVFGKLAVTTRAELAAAATRRGM